MKVGDRIKIDGLVPANPGAVSTACFSNSFSMQDFRNAAILVSCATNTTGISMKGYIVAGVATEASSAMSQLVGSSFVVAEPGSTVKSGVEVRIAARGTISTASTGLTVTISDGNKQYTITAATVSAFTTGTTAMTVAVTNATVFASQLATLINDNVSYARAAALLTAATDTDVIIQPKGVGDCLITVATTGCATASSDTFGAKRVNQSALVEFSAEDLTSTNSSYTHAAVFITSTDGSSATQFSAMLIRTDGRMGVTQTVGDHVRVGVTS